MAKHVFNHMENVKRKDFFMISYDDFLKLKPFHLNPASRTEGFGDDEDDQNLINFIKKNGVLNLPPIGINKTQNGDIIVNGHRCSAAIKIAKGQGAPVEYVNAILVGRNMTDEEMLSYTIATNNGKKFTNVEMADSCKFFLQCGWTKQDIADKIGSSLQTVNNYLELADCSKQLKERVNSKEMPASVAKEIKNESGGNKEEEDKRIAEFDTEKALGLRGPKGKKSRATIDLKPGEKIENPIVGNEKSEDKPDKKGNPNRRKPMTHKDMMNWLTGGIPYLEKKFEKEGNKEKLALIRERKRVLEVCLGLRTIDSISLEN